MLCSYLLWIFLFVKRFYSQRIKAPRITEPQFYLSQSIRSFVGGLMAGMIIDYIVKRECRLLGGIDPPPEVHLKAIWTGEFLVLAGLLIYGFTLTIVQCGLRHY